MTTDAPPGFIRRALDCGHSLLWRSTLSAPKPGDIVYCCACAGYRADRGPGRPRRPSDDVNA